MQSQPRQPIIATELALLLALATLWGASYSFIKLGVATIPPVTLIAARTLIAGLLLLVIMRWRGITLPTDAATWRRFLLQACLNSVIPWTMLAWSERTLDAGLATILNSTSPIFTFFLTLAITRHEALSAAKAVRRVRRHGRHLPDRRRGGASRPGRATGRADRDRAGRHLPTPAPRSSAVVSRVSIRWRRPPARCCVARRS